MGPGPHPNAGPPAAMLCSECGLFHPPLPDGMKCPSKLEKLSNGEAIDLGNFMLNMKNIVMSHIHKNNIKDYKKLLALILIKVTKSLENYKDDGTNIN
jgi:hypothetical protein